MIDLLSSENQTKLFLHPAKPVYFLARVVNNTEHISTGLGRYKRLLSINIRKTGREYYLINKTIQMNKSKLVLSNKILNKYQVLNIKYFLTDQ